MYEAIKQLLVEGHFEKALSRFDELSLSRGQRDELLILRSHVNEYQAGIMTMSEDYRQRLRANIVKEGFRLINQVEDAQKVVSQPPVVPPTPAAAAVPVHTTTTRTVAGVKKRNQSWILIGAAVLGLVLMVWVISSWGDNEPPLEPRKAKTEITETDNAKAEVGNDNMPTSPGKSPTANLPTFNNDQVGNLEQPADVSTNRETVEDLKLGDKTNISRLLRFKNLRKEGEMGVLLYGTLLNRRTNLLQAQQKLVGQLNEYLTAAKAISLESISNFHSSSTLEQLLKAEIPSSFPTNITQRLLLTIKLDHSRSGATLFSTFSFNLYDQEKKKYVLQQQSRTFETREGPEAAQYIAGKINAALESYSQNN